MARGSAGLFPGDGEWIFPGEDVGAPGGMQQPHGEPVPGSGYFLWHSLQLSGPLSSSAWHPLQLLWASSLPKPDSFPPAALA